MLIIYIYIKRRMVDDARDGTWLRKIESILEAKIQKDQWGSTELIIDADRNIEGFDLVVDGSTPRWPEHHVRDQNNAGGLFTTEQVDVYPNRIFLQPLSSMVFWYELLRSILFPSILGWDRRC